MWVISCLWYYVVVVGCFVKERLKIILKFRLEVRCKYIRDIDCKVVGVIGNFWDKVRMEDIVINRIK